ncbi:uncharacterized protein METZ01_LOCUS255193 [marine metagenome]|uniref:Uncharacterized protein n=1 Tax=marine metagenome TaxID=408172 RepID=A0A382ISV5_9ZZZZ
MLNSTPKKSGYVCVPYQHDKFSINVKDTWDSSRNIKSIYFVTATFSDECKPYFPFSTNHYLLAKFDDEQKLIKDAEKFTNSKPSFVFTVDNELFERDLDSERSFISTYYLEYNDPDALSDIANTIVKKDKIRQAGFAHMNLFCDDKPKFTFPYTEKLVVLELSDDRSPQSINKYCEKTRQDISRKGVVMNNFVSLSLLEKLK